jgi:SAM-dependent methyltransferase
MSAYASKIPLQPLFDAFDWESLGDCTIVDVAGGYGPVSLALAGRFLKPHFIVQDFLDVVEDGPKHLPKEIRTRVEFMEYDILTPQVAKGADVYFFRAVFHNWTDKYCVSILRNHVEAMRKGGILIIVDPCLQEPGTLPWVLERRSR